MANLRARDMIDVAQAWGVGDIAALNARFFNSTPQVVLRHVLADQEMGRIGLISSFGAESAVLLALVAEIAPATPVLFLETGKHFPETLAYRDTLVERLELTDVRTIAPDPVELAAKDARGERWSYDPDGCCALRKVAPLVNAQANFDTLLTGRKGFQADTRAALPRFEVDRSGSTAKLKVNPLIAWSKADLDDYFTRHALPRHPLEAQGYLSIGCAPCTSKVLPGEDPRAGRWRGSDKLECGIHVPPDTPAPIAG